MSDFDKEAEREKLRQRFEAEEEDREITARMSELLLQGATMTNRHCDTCHSPVFTYQGQSFCPTCQVEIGDPDSETADADGVDAGHADPIAADADTGAEPAAAGDSRSATRIEVDDPGNGADTRPSASSETDASPEPASTSTSARTSESTVPTPSPDPASTAERTHGSAGSADATAADANGDSDLAAAHASLSRTLSRLSERAERSEDLSRTREYLLATQEAAEALAALKQARR